MQEHGAEQRALFRRWPAGVSVVVAEVDGRRHGLTVASLLAGDQEHLAQHFARSVPPIALWNGIELRDDDPRLLAGAAGWLTARTVEEVRTGDHTFFVSEVLSIEQGVAEDSLTYVHRGYKAV